MTVDLLHKMLTVYIVFFVLGAVVASDKLTYWNMRNESPEIFSEIPCLTFGGMCVMAEDCPDGNLAQVSGLCPLQQPSGVECCYGLPKSEKRCGRRGGECMPRETQCPDQLTFTGASDCEANEKCCILVK